MSMLSEMFREKVGKVKDSSRFTNREMTYSVSYPVGILPIDWAISYIQEINGKLKAEVGIPDGTINTLIGNSGTGKTSLLVKMACNIIKPFKTSCIFFEQAETTGVTIQRIKNITGFRTDEEFLKKFIVRDSGITIESILERVLAIHDIKINNPKKYLYDTGLIGPDGEKVFKFEPTVVIVDSLKLVPSMTNPIDKDTTNMTGAQTAKSHTECFSKMLQLCKTANIIMILVNHIVKAVHTDRTPRKAEFTYLAQDEHLPNATLLNYISNLMLRLDIKGKLIKDDDKNPFGISGTLVNVDVVKSRTSTSGRAKCMLVYDQDLGYDSDLSTLLMLRMNNLIGKTSPYRIPGCDRKFTQKNFKNLLYTDPEFFNAFNNFCYDWVLRQWYDTYERAKIEAERMSASQSTYDHIIDRFNQFNNSNATSLPESVYDSPTAEEPSANTLESLTESAQDIGTAMADASVYDSN